MNKLLTAHKYLFEIFQFHAVSLLSRRLLLCQNLLWLCSQNELLANNYSFFLFVIRNGINISPQTPLDNMNETREKINAIASHFADKKNKQFCLLTNKLNLMLMLIYMLLIYNFGMKQYFRHAKFFFLIKHKGDNKYYCLT